MEKSKSFSGGRRYTNGEITVYWKPDACVHASYCYRELLEVFDPSKRPWVDMFGATTSQIIEVVDMCPTEALSWKWNDEAKNKEIDPRHLNHVNFRRPELIGTPDDPPEEKHTSVKIMPDGPIVISGSFTVKYDGHNKEVNESMISLCRCGSSLHMPFCDGAHRKTGYIDK